MNDCELKFQDYGIDNYRLFLKAKAIPEFSILLGDDGISHGLKFPARFAHMVGMKVDAVEQQRLPMPDFLFDDQRAIVEMALDAKRFADWKDCGLGKTNEILEWSRQVAHITGKRVLIVTMNEIVEQFRDECSKFYKLGEMAPPFRLETREQMIEWCGGRLGDGTWPQVAITNYEKFNPTDGVERIPEIGLLGGLALDESSRLKTGGGKQKWSIIKSSRGVPYKLSATGTPAPNEAMEFASQASFLEKIRDENDVIWTYFSKDKNGEWGVKKHARPHFFRWMASWSIYVADPKAYGWRLGSAVVPEPEFQYDVIEATKEQVRLLHAASAGANGTADLFGDKRLGMVSQLQLLEAAKGFLYVRQSGSSALPQDREKIAQRWIPVLSEKPMHVATLAKKQFCEGRQTLIWCEYDAEVEILAQLLTQLGFDGKFRTLGGSTKAKDRLPILDDFRRGKLPILLGKSRMLGFGQNFQNCSAMIFSGFSDSFESFYQAVRRSYRYGQSEKLKVFIPYIAELEGPVLQNLLNKVQRFGELIKEQQGAYIAARKELSA